MRLRHAALLLALTSAPLEAQEVRVTVYDPAAIVLLYTPGEACEGGTPQSSLDVCYAGPVGDTVDFDAVATTVLGDTLDLAALGLRLVWSAEGPAATIDAVTGTAVFHAEGVHYVRARVVQVGAPPSGGTVAVRWCIYRDADKGGGHLTGFPHGCTDGPAPSWPDTLWDMLAEPHRARVG